MDAGAHVATERGRWLDLHRVPPHLRLALVPALRAPGEPLVVGDIAVTASVSTDATYLRAADRRTRLWVDGVHDDLAVSAALEDALQRSWRQLEPDLYWITVLLAAFDGVVRAAGVYDGNVYLADSDAVARVLGTAGIRVTDIDDRLLELQQLEVMYRFPVALKFRGSFGTASQCRVNGWGRLAASLATAHDTEDADWRVCALASEVESHAERYRDRLEYLRRCTDGAPARAVPTTPIAVLV